MDIEEMERITRDQIREIQEEYNQRITPLIKILSDIDLMKPITFALSESEYKGAWGPSTLHTPEYQRAQDELNRTYREMIDKIPTHSARD